IPRHAGVRAAPARQIGQRASVGKRAQLGVVPPHLRCRRNLTALNPVTMEIDFAEYLAAKFGLDERSLNPDVRRVCFERLRGAKALRCLDVGTGTGAMVRRLAESEAGASLFVTALDRDPELIRIASNDLAESLVRRRFQVRVQGN